MKVATHATLAKRMIWRRSLRGATCGPRAKTKSHSSASRQVM